jgi:RNA polymerase sigma-70 factor (ECF subfamily)
VVDDVCQETFIEAYRHLNELRRDESFPAWIRTIARHRVFAVARQRQREPALGAQVIAGLEEVFTAVDRNAGETFTEKLNALRACFDELPVVMRDCCRQHYFDGERVSDIAEKLGQSLSAILKRLQRAREALGDCITKRLQLDHHT